MAKQASVPKRPRFADPRFLHRVRQECKITQQQLADEAGLQQSVIAELESGTRLFTEHYQVRVWDAISTISKARRLRCLSPGMAKRIWRKMAKIKIPESTELENTLLDRVEALAIRNRELERQVATLTPVRGRFELAATEIRGMVN